MCSANGERNRQEGAILDNPRAGLRALDVRRYTTDPTPLRG